MHMVLFLLITLLSNLQHEQAQAVSYNQREDKVYLPDQTTDNTIFSDNQDNDVISSISI